MELFSTSSVACSSRSLQSMCSPYDRAISKKADGRYAADLFLQLPARGSGSAAILRDSKTERRLTPLHGGKGHLPFGLVDRSIDVALTQARLSPVAAVVFMDLDQGRRA